MLLGASRFIPVRDLNTDEDTNHDDYKVETYGEPVLVAHVLYHSAKSHRKFHTGVVTDTTGIGLLWRGQSGLQRPLILSAETLISPDRGAKGQGSSKRILAQESSL